MGGWNQNGFLGDSCGEGCIQLAQGRNQCQAFVNMVMNLRVLVPWS
jgi:hypothetical protein